MSNELSTEPTERSIDERIARDASTTFMVTTHRRLRALGLTNASIARRVGRLLRPYGSGVYIIGEPSRTTLAFAAIAKRPVAATARHTAAGLLDLPIDKVDEISLVAPNGHGRPIFDEVVLRQTRLLDESDIVMARGLRSTSVPRTICDLAAVLPARKIQELIGWAITNRRMTRTEFQACARAFCRSGRKGSTLIRQLNIALLNDEQFPASELERRAIRLFRSAGLEGFVAQFVPHWSNGVSGIVDTAWPELRTIVELDGRRWHTVTKALENDRRRDRAANSHGWFVLRFGWQEIVERPEAVIRELKRFLATRRKSLAA